MIGPFGKELKIGSQINRWRTKVGFYSAEKEREMKRTSKAEKTRVVEAMYQGLRLPLTLFFAFFLFSLLKAIIQR